MTASTDTAPKHTPGPWGRLDPEIFGHRPIGSSIDLHANAEPNAPWVASVMGTHVGNSFEQVQANAHLIAAAPDLLAALREFVGADEANGGQFADRSVVELARAAIAAARGEVRS